MVARRQECAKHNCQDKNHFEFETLEERKDYPCGKEGKGKKIGPVKPPLQASCKEKESDSDETPEKM
jgi:hypothetical protein